jgi:hypothetical protein
MMRAWLAFGTRGRGDALALAAYLLENSRPDFLGIVEATEPHGNNLDAVLARGLAADPPRQLGQDRVQVRPVADRDQIAQVMNAELGGQHRRGHLFQPRLGIGHGADGAQESVDVGDPPAHIPGDLEVFLVPRQHLAGRGRVELEPAVEGAGRLMRPLEMQARPLDQANRPAELGDEDRLGLFDQDRHPKERHNRH